MSETPIFEKDQLKPIDTRVRKLEGLLEQMLPKGKALPSDETIRILASHNGAPLLYSTLRILIVFPVWEAIDTILKTMMRNGNYSIHIHSIQADDKGKWTLTLHDDNQKKIIVFTPEKIIDNECEESPLRDIPKYSGRGGVGQGSIDGLANTHTALQNPEELSLSGKLDFPGEN